MRTDSGKLCVIGDAFVDLLVPTGNIKPGGAVDGDIRVAFGGTANVARWAARNGAPCKFFGKVGEDPLGAAFKANLKEEGIEDLVLSQRDSETGICLCLIDKSGERSMITRRGANGTLSLVEAESNLDKILEGTTTLFFTGYSFVARANVEAILFLLNQASLRYKEIWFNPGAWNIISDGYLDLSAIERCCSVLIMNLDEAKALAGEGAGEAKEVVLRLGERFKTVIMTMGKGGCFIVENGDKLSFLPSEKVERVVDTTGAGDAFAGACLAGRLKGYSLPDCCKLGHREAAGVVQRLGAG